MAYSPPGKSRERVYRFVRQRILAGGPPTIREVQQAMGFRAVESARSHLEALCREGRLVKETGKARGYRLPGGARPKAPAEPLLVPLLGRVQAGALSLALEAPEGHLVVQARQGAAELFALRVEGESMTGAGILPGDVVVVRRQPLAESGEVVVAMVEGEATVKRLRLGPDGPELHPENPRFQPIIAGDRPLELLGKVIEVRRYLDHPEG